MYIGRDYSVYAKNILDQKYICWSNLTHEMNETAVFIVKAETETRSTERPLQHYKYIEAHFIIVAGKLLILQ